MELPAAFRTEATLFGMPLRPPNILFLFLLLAVFLAPLPFASVLEWSWSLLSGVIGLLLILWAILVVWERRTIPVPPRHIMIPLVLFAAAMLWALLQTASWTPEGWHHPVWAEAASLLDTEVRSRIAIDADIGRSAVMRMVAYGGIFWISLQSCRSGRTAKFALYAFAVVSVLYALYGLFIEFTGANMVLWISKTTYLDNLTSTFINRSAYAAYAGLGLIVFTALLAARLQNLLEGGEGRREIVRNLLLSFARQDWSLVVGWIVMATTVMLTDSRAGFAASAVALLAFLICLGFASSVRRRTRMALGVLLLLAGIGFAGLSGGTVLSRLAETTAEDSPEQIRIALSELTIEAIRDSPVLGTGYSSWEHVMHIYRGDEEPFRQRSTRAHNTYLENAMELGVPAAVALLGSILGVVMICVAGLRRRRKNAAWPAIGIAISVIPGIQSLVDFSVQMPAFTATWAFLLGLACAQSWSSRVNLAGNPGSGRR